MKMTLIGVAAAVVALSTGPDVVGCKCKTSQENGVSACTATQGAGCPSLVVVNPNMYCASGGWGSCTETECPGCVHYMHYTYSDVDSTTTYNATCTTADGGSLDFSAGTQGGLHAQISAAGISLENCTFSEETTCTCEGSESEPEYGVTQC